MDSNSVYLETKIGSNEFKPINLRWNQYIEFNGNKLRHYNVKNISGQSRVSLDFRIIPFSKFIVDYEKQSVHGKRKFLIGDYYIKLKVKEE